MVKRRSTRSSTRSSAPCPCAVVLQSAVALIPQAFTSSACNSGCYGEPGAGQELVALHGSSHSCEFDLGKRWSVPSAPYINPVIVACLGACRTIRTLAGAAPLTHLPPANPLTYLPSCPLTTHSANRPPCPTRRSHAGPVFLRTMQVLGVLTSIWNHSVTGMHTGFGSHPGFV